MTMSSRLLRTRLRAVSTPRATFTRRPHTAGSWRRCSRAGRLATRWHGAERMTVGARMISVRVNGTHHEREVEPRLSLADFLREDLRLTGTTLGCEQGVCG